MYFCLLQSLFKMLNLLNIVLSVFAASISINLAKLLVHLVYLDFEVLVSEAQLLVVLL